MCQINFEVYGNSSNKYFNHESSNFMLSGNRRRGRQKPKNKKKALPGFPRLHLTYVGCPERAPPPGIRSRTIYPDAHVASTWFLNILRYVDKCEEGRVTMRTVPNAIIIDDTQPRTPNQSFISLRLRRAVRPPVLSDRTKRDGRSSSWRKSFSPCLCRPVLRLTEGPE